LHQIAPIQRQICRFALGDHVAQAGAGINGHRFAGDSNFTFQSRVVL
jgi:hypothetical protein